MGAMKKQKNVKPKKKNNNRNNKITNGGNKQPPSLLQMRPRPPYPPPPLFHPRMGPPPPPPHMCGPPMMRHRPFMGPPPMMGPPMRPPMMGPPRRFPPFPPMPPRPLMPPPPHMMMGMPPNKMGHFNQNMQQNQRRKSKRSPSQKNKKKGTPFNLTNPWVNDAIRTEYELKDKLFTAAKESDKKEDWDKFRDQRVKCNQMYKSAKIEYIGQHPEEVYDDEDSSGEDEEMEENEEEGEVEEEMNEICDYEPNYNSTYFCDTCERSFRNEYQLNCHLQEHRVCGIDGCTFVAHAKIVEKHIDMQHVTGLYYRIAKTETPEDIAKWIAERKKRYPSKENIEKRQQEQAEKLKRGERIQTEKGRFGRHTKRDVPTGNTNLNQRPFKRETNLTERKSKRMKLSQRRTKPTKTSLLNDRSSWNGLLPPFEGTSELYEDETEIEDQLEKFDDTEWLATTPEKEIPKIEINNSLGALIGAYRSSSDDEIPISESCHVQEKVLEEAPEEQTISRTDPLLHIKIDDKSNEKKIKRNIKSDRIRNRRKPNSVPENPKSNLFTDRKLVRRRITLLERLLASDIKHERNVILQCVRYVVENDFFDQNKLETLSK